jgi:hypothetical protein
MEVLCVDGKFSLDQLQFYAKHGVATPQAEKLYSIRSVIKNSNGQVGVLLEELKNPPIPFKHPILGITQNEPNWALTRFRKLDGSPVSKEEVEESVKVSR